MQLSIEIPDKIAQDMRSLLAESSTDEDALSDFVLEAVKDRIFAEAVRQIKTRNAAFDQQGIMDIAEEAVSWARETGH